MTPTPDRPRRIVWWLFSALAAILVLALLIELVRDFLVASGVL
jgi:hypothetical protein